MEYRIREETVVKSRTGRIKGGKPKIYDRPKIFQMDNRVTDFSPVRFTLTILTIFLFILGLVVLIYNSRRQHVALQHSRYTTHQDL